LLAETVAFIDHCTLVLFAGIFNDMILTYLYALCPGSLRYCEKWAFVHNCRGHKCCWVM